MHKVRKVKKVKKVKRKTQDSNAVFTKSGEFAFIPEGDLQSLARPIEELKLLEDNPRKNDKAAQALAELIKKNGFRKPIVINQDNEIKAGNTAYKAAKILGMSHVPAVASAWVSTKEEWDYVLSDNKASEYSEWDPEILAKLIDKKEVIVEGDNSTGFSEHELFKITNFSDVKFGKKSASSAGEGLFTREQIVEALFQEFRERGFPYPSLSLGECMQELNRLHALDKASCLNSNVGYRIVDTYNWHRFESSAQGMRSSIESFEDDKALRKTINCMLDSGRASYRYDSFMALVNGTQICNHWRPAFTKMIYNQYAPEGGTIFDPCFGYGGGFVGFFASHCSKYIGVDPSEQSYNSNCEMGDDLCPKDKKFKLYNLPIEDFKSSVLKNSCDFAFTSPPYFSKEKYDSSPNQSWKKYPKYEDWLEGFLRSMFLKCKVVLRSGSLFVLNVEDVKIGGKKYPLVTDSIRMGRRCGFIFEEKKHFELRSRTNVSIGKDGSKVKTVLPAKEAVLFFRRK